MEAEELKKKEGGKRMKRIPSILNSTIAIKEPMKCDEGGIT